MASEAPGRVQAMREKLEAEHHVHKHLAKHRPSGLKSEMVSQRDEEDGSIYMSPANSRRGSEINLSPPAASQFTPRGSNKMLNPLNSTPPKSFEDTGRLQDGAVPEAASGPLRPSHPQAVKPSTPDRHIVKLDEDPAPRTPDRLAQLSGLEEQALDWSQNPDPLGPEQEVGCSQVLEIVLKVEQKERARRKRLAAKAANIEQMRLMNEIKISYQLDCQERDRALALACEGEEAERFRRISGDSTEAIQAPGTLEAVRRAEAEERARRAAEDATLAVLGAQRDCDSCRRRINIEFSKNIWPSVDAKLKTTEAHEDYQEVLKLLNSINWMRKLPVPQASRPLDMDRTPMVSIVKEEPHSPPAPKPERKPQTPSPQPLPVQHELTFV